MPGISHRVGRNARVVAGLLLIAFAASGCSQAGADVTGSLAPRSSFASSGGLTESFSSSSPAMAPQLVVGAQPDVNCPAVEIRRGASTLSVGSGPEKTAMTLKYQGSFARADRECSVADANLVMKIGIEGRIILGPAGSPGQVDVPLRIAVVYETPGGMKTIATKFVLVPVTIAAGQGNVNFTHVEDGISFPIPSPATQLDDYIVYIGFDPVSAEARGKQKPPPKPKGKSPAAGAN
jgi:hypothetical protein